MSAGGTSTISTSERAIVAILSNASDIAASRRDALLDFIAKPSIDAHASPLPDRVLTVEEVAAALRQTKRTIHRLCTERQLVRVRFPGRKNAAGILSSSVSDLIRKSIVSVGEK